MCVSSGAAVSLTEADMLFLCWLLSSKMFPDTVELILLGTAIVLWCTLLYDTVFRNLTEEVFQ